MQERLGTLAAQLEIITRRIRTLGLTRAADDLVKVTAEIRRLERAADAQASRSGGVEAPAVKYGQAT